MKKLDLFLIHHEKEVKICQMLEERMWELRRKGYIFVSDKNFKYYIKNSEELMKHCKDKKHIWFYRICLRRLKEVFKNG